MSVSSPWMMLSLVFELIMNNIFSAQNVVTLSYHQQTRIVTTSGSLFIAAIHIARLAMCGFDCPNVLGARKALGMALQLWKHLAGNGAGSVSLAP